MRDKLPAFRELGARAVLIGNGSPQEAAQYRREMGLTCEVLVDPELVGYRALELRRSLVANLHPRSFFAGIRLFRAGFRGGATQGDALQLGGVFVITPAGRVTWSFRSTRPDDYPRVEHVLAAAERATQMSR